MSLYQNAQREVARMVIRIKSSFRPQIHYLLIYYYAYGRFKDVINDWSNSNCTCSLNTTVLYWIVNTDCGLLSFQTEELLILTL